MPQLQHRKQISIGINDLQSRLPYRTSVVPGFLMHRSAKKAL